ncbi:hypothetical protein CFP71_02910 [Amycolatopsis thailandensis]|uniref:Carrier domain-containing protein n=1 Tax=Amycolatopsis thailandensis TaxID=589330 RepID=A0A229SI25_9PSEU|nr:acyl carrier protein [Amycolatopsis thailandensis]OXM58506.1 hypothetical protein CFP71_02910 [Amycolatopsis thailandensis]
MSSEADRAAELQARILAFVHDELANEAERALVTASAPLLEIGVLDSLRTTRLIAWLREEFGVRVPPLAMTGKNFRDVGSITTLVLDLRTAA